MAERILLVDDEVDFLDVVGEFLEDEGYEMTTAENGRQALAILERQTFDLLLSDINMPGMKGFELLREAAARYPAMRRALITAYDVRDYLYMAKNYDIGNIITKTTPFNFDEIRVLLRTILTGDIFGLGHYIKGTIHTKTIRQAGEIEDAVTTIAESMEEDEHKRKFRQALGEIVVNAFFYGARDERGDQKDKWEFGAELSPREAVIVSWGSDAEKTGASVTDQKGRLTKKEVLYWLERNTTKGSDGLSLGLLDEHGKGLYIARETIDRFIVNVEKGKRTEAVMINYKRGLYDGHRPLWIHEI
ncbi:MAG: response regulator [Chitinivibrionales bacterium]|nr:response regulator [Chitinivibrionales bacterium]MBD3394530.1 response regulator [Chitinivibrionales bacterium]